MTIIKQISSFILPVTVLVIVPYFIEPNKSPHCDMLGLLGLIFGSAGLTIMYLTISSFAMIGKGTLAPWAPTQRLVVSGLYRYMRNPMITGVLLVLIGEALVLHSKNIISWAVVFAVINTIYFIFVEEPGLEKRFGESYREYKRNVNRWIPRLSPYSASKQRAAVSGKRTTNS